MATYILSLIALMLNFMALLSCIRFTFSRQYAYWILPSLISLILSLQNLNTILIIGTSSTVQNVITFNDITPTILALLWYAMIIIFHYALKLAIPQNKFINDSRKNRSEALYLEKLEERQNKKLREERAETTANRTNIPTVRNFRGPDIG